jgi:hypothetical protein
VRTFWEEMQGEVRRVTAAAPGADPRRLEEFVKDQYMTRQPKMRQLSLTSLGQALLFHLLLDQVRGRRRLLPRPAPRLAWPGLA